MLPAGAAAGKPEATNRSNRAAGPGARAVRRPAQGVRQESLSRWDPACGPIRSIPPSTDHEAPVT